MNKEQDLVEDGFGSASPAVCPGCGCRAVYVCRPGAIRCGVCYDGNPKEWYDENGLKPLNHKPSEDLVDKNKGE